MPSTPPFYFASSNEMAITLELFSAITFFVFVSLHLKCRGGVAEGVWGPSLFKSLPNCLIGISKIYHNFFPTYKGDMLVSNHSYHIRLK